MSGLLYGTMQSGGGWGREGEVGGRAERIMMKRMEANASPNNGK